MKQVYYNADGEGGFFSKLLGSVSPVGAVSGAISGIAGVFTSGTQKDIANAQANQAIINGNQQTLQTLLNTQSQSSIEKQKSQTTIIIVAVVAVVAILGLVLFLTLKK
jgi:hypothetical protein